MRLAIISTHPIQYYSPIFQLLGRSSRVHARVFYTWSQTAATAPVDPWFGKAITWDIPLLEGYEYEFVPNVARKPGTGHFWGLRNPGLIRAVESWGAEAVLVFGWNCASHLQAMRHFKGRIPVFFRGDSTLLGRSPGLRTVTRRVALTWIYRHIDVAIAVGSNNEDYFRWSGVPDDRIAFAPHAVDTRRFADAEAGHAERAMQWRRELDIGDGARTILFAGKLYAIKEPVMLLEAFTACSSPGAHLLFVGNGSLEAELRRRASGRNDVHFLPFQNQQAMPSVYRLGDVFVLPSRSETWGLALNEAMASGCVSIASDKVGGARDLIVPGENGWVFRAGDRADLERVLTRALKLDQRELQTMCAAAREHGAGWSIEAAAAGIELAVLGFRGRQAGPAYG